jgi:hypothetical protein
MEFILVNILLDAQSDASKMNNEEITPKNPFHTLKTAFRHAKRGFRHGCPGKEEMPNYL